VWADFKKNFMFGLAFGMGFFCAYGLLMLIVRLINAIAGGGHLQVPAP